MESWTRVIVEWVNCLGIVQPTIEDLQDLKNGVFYNNLVTKLSHADKQVATNASPDATMTTLITSIDEKEPVSRFIQGEYPEFMKHDECHSGIPDELYTASLLLTKCSQNGAFHRPMCSNLKHETQIHIKRFLELVLPYGKSLTREVLGAAITEVGDATPNTPPSTPKPLRPLREFFNSPAARSAHSQRFMNDRNREIRRLKAELETERFEKADLIEDMQIQNEKLLNLQKKLEIKSQELRALRNERLKPPTPQSCRKNKRASDTEERYKRELEEFENANAALKSEIEDLQDEREQLARRIASKDRVHEILKEKLDETEKTLEALTLQIETKNNELLNMRMNNEQLREHIREIQRSSLGEQSFEMESIGRVRSPTFLNSSEALSSIVDIQLQEAKEESAQLKIQLDAFNRRFEALTRESEEIKSLNYELHAKTAELAETANKNEFLQSELNKAEATIRETEDKVKHLSDELTSVEDKKIECSLAKEKIEEYAKHADEKILTLEAKISDCEVRIQELNDVRTKEMEISTILRDELAEKSSVIDVLTQRLKESANRESASTAHLDAANEKFAELTERAKETETKLAHERKQLLQKQNELARTVSDKHILEEKIASFTQLEENMKQQIDRLRVELEESQKNLSQQIAVNATLKETENQLKDVNHELEEKLTREQNRLTLMLGEKNALEKELALSVESTAKAEKHIKNIEKALDECDKKLKEQVGCNEVLENEKIELNRTKSNLEKNLELARQELLTIKAEKDALNEELLSQVSSAAELRERIEMTEKNLAESQENLQKQLAANALLRDEQHDLEKHRTELEKELLHKREEFAAIENEKETLKEETSVCIDSLKNQLAECTKKLQEQLDAITVLENEKIELTAMRSNLEKNLEMERRELSTIRAEKDTLNEELSSHVRLAAELRERIEKIEKNLAESQENLQKQLAANALLRDEQHDLEKHRTELEKELSHKREEFAAIEKEKETLKEETYVCIDSLKNQLAECTKQLQEQLEANTVLENEKIELNEMRFNLEKNLEMERRELSTIRAEKDTLNEELSSQVCSAAELRERIEKIEQNLAESQENLQKQLAANALLLDEQHNLEKQRTELEKELSHKREELAAIENEKETLKEETSVCIDSLKNQLAECTKQLQEQLEANTVLENEKIELNAMRFNLEKNLEMERRELSTIRAEKDTLNEEFSSQVRSAAELRERIEKIEKSLAESQENLQKQLAANALLRDEQHDLEKQRTELEKELSHKREELAAIENEKETLKEETSVCIDSLKNQLAKCTKTLQEQLDAITVLENEKIELNEMRFNLEKNLEMERQELSTIRAEKDTLTDELSSHVRSAAERIEKIEQNLAESQENLQKQLAANALLRDEQHDLEKQRTELEKELSHKQEELAAIENEKETLKEETSLCIDSLKNQLAECTKKLQEQLDANTVLENEKIELKEMKFNLEKNLEMERQELSTIRVEKDTLNEELSSHVRSAAELRERIEKIEKNLAESQENLQKQLAANALLRDEQHDLEKQRTELEKELSHKREELAAIENEKETLKEETSVCIDSLKNQLAECTITLQKQLDAITVLENEKIELNGMRSNLEKNLEMERQELSTIRAEKDTLNEQLSSQVRSAAELRERIEKIENNLAESQENLQKQLAANALLRDEQHDLEKQRTELEKELSQKREELAAIENEKETLIEELSLRIDSLNSQLVEYKNREEELQETLRISEAEKSQVTNDLRLVRDKSASLEKRIAEISEESNRRVEEITTLTETQLNELKRERDRLTETLNERNQSSNDLVASLEKRLFSSEKSCAEAKLEEKLKEEAIGLLSVKLEQLTKEKIESELRMKEVILNLQEVRRSQDGVLEAQVKTLKETSLQLDEATKEIASVKVSLVAKSAELEKESKLAEGLQEALEIERNNVKESIDRCEDLKNDMENIARVASDLKLELKTLWDTVSSVCPEVVNPQDNQSLESGEFLETAKVTDAIISMGEKAKATHEAVAILIESNEKLKNKMEKMTKASGSLKLEMNALRDTVREICPELAGPKEGISSPEDGSIDDPNETDISCAIESFAKDAKTIGKAVSILSEANETLKEHLDNEKKITMSSKSEAEQKKNQLDERIATMECEREKRDRYLSSLVKRKKDLQKLVSTVVAKRDDVDDKLGTLTNKWRNLANEVQSLLNAGSSSCDEIKHLQNKRTELDEIFANINDRHTRGSKPLLKALCRIFVWSELKLRDANSQLAGCNLADAVVKNEFCTDDNELYGEEELLKVEISNNEEIREALEDIGEKIDSFSCDLKSYETGLKVGAIKREASNEEKLQTQLEKVTKERKEMKEKLDAMRTRNAKLEKNMDDLRNENKKLKSHTPTPPSVAVPADVTEIERLEKLTENLTKEIQRLQRDNEQLSKNKTSELNDEARLKEVHNEYGLKLEKIKQKMKTAYNEQIAKLNEEQEKTMKNKIEALRGQMEQQCRKYTDDIAKYKAHITDLSSRYWDVGEKLLAETQEKQAALQQLQQLKGQKLQQQHQQIAMAEANQHLPVAQSRQKTASLDRRDFGADRTMRESSTRPGYRAVEMIEEETTTYSTRRRSVQSIQAMGNAFNAEDEEGEVFDSVYLADLKEGRCAPLGPDFDRISELRSRNSMCKPHLRSSYAVETHVQPIALTEDDIKNGATGDDVFNDSLSQSLLPGQKPKKKDRTQTSYKRPGPPTPSKNGGRLSLQGNELKSPGRGILKEKNVDRRTTATPKGLKNLFGTSISRRQDENSTSTPRARRLSNIFRKQRTDRN